MQEDQPPGSPGEQRRREKATLQQLNERLETVLVNIRRDNIAKARQIKDLEGETKISSEVSGLVKDNQRAVDKSQKETILAKSLQLAKVAKNSSIRKDVDHNLAVVGHYDDWANADNTGNLGGTFVDLSTTIAHKKLELMTASSSKSYHDYMLNKMKSAEQLIDEHTAREATKEDSLRAEDAAERDQLAQLQQRNDESARKVALYENPELDDAMQERVLLALDRKERLLQTELKDKIDTKAQEISDGNRASGNSNQIFTPRKMDLYGEHVQLENEIRNLEEDRLATELKNKAVQSEKTKVLEESRGWKDEVDKMQQLISSAETEYAALTDEIAALKSDGHGDKKVMDLNKQLGELDNSNAVRAARFNKAQQVLQSALDDTEDRFKSVVNLDAVLKDYERIIEDYEQQYQGKRQPVFAPPHYAHIGTGPTTSGSLASSSTSSTSTAATQGNKPKKVRIAKTTTTTTTTTRTSKQVSQGTSQGFPNTAGKEKPAGRMSAPLESVGRLVFPEESIPTDSALPSTPSAASTGDDSIYLTPAALPYTPNETGKKKRKEPPPSGDEESTQTTEAESENAVPNSPLEITTFSAVAQKVVILNRSSDPVNLTGYKIRNCDYNISQVFPSVVLPSGGSFTINPRPRNTPAKLPKYCMFWQEGDYGTFTKDSKGVRVLGLNGDLICARK